MQDQLQYMQRKQMKQRNIKSDYKSNTTEQIMQQFIESNRELETKSVRKKMQRWTQTLVTTWPKKNVMKWCSHT